MLFMLNMVCHRCMHSLCGFLLHTPYFLYVSGNLLLFSKGNYIMSFMYIYKYMYIFVGYITIITAASQKSSGGSLS